MTANAQPDTRLTGRWLTLARLLWIVLAVGYLMLWLASLPGFYERVSTLTIEPYRLAETTIRDNESVREDALERGLSLEANAIFEIAFGLFQIVVYYLLTALIAWRTSDGFGWFTAFVLLLFSIGSSMGTVVGVAPSFPYAHLLIQIPGYLVWPAWLGWLYLFPNGLPVPRRIFLPFALFLSAFTALQVLSLLGVAGILPAQIETFGRTVGPLTALPAFGVVLYSQIYRYLRASIPTERQQTKWLLFGLGVFFGFLVAFVLFPDSFRSSAIIQDTLTILFLIFPVSVAVAILRYRLFDIDLLIRRTLQYSLLSGVLALTYFGLIIVLQNAFTAITGQRQNDFVTVVSTLAIAALFAPLRRLVQDVIDRRFYRKKYDAQKVLAEFAATCRDETDLEKLTARLVEVVQETMQPENISLWLKK
ncbi:MAG TPA: hypothetical protein VJL59_00885 [Anaerolineales bacterium]|nr:hypothetical protein [Anaerolineales bacterium]